MAGIVTKIINAGRFIVSFLLLGTFGSLLSAQGPGGANTTGQRLIFLPEKPFKIFPQLYADPYEIQLGMVKSLDSDQFIGRIGQRIYLLRYNFGDESSPVLERNIFFGLSGSTWSLLSRQGNKFPLMAVDFLIAGFFDLRLGNFSTRLKISHISAHLGDKFFSSAEATVKPRVFSQEFISGYGTYQWQQLFVYGAVHWFYHTIPDLEPFNFQLGGTLYLGEPLGNKFCPYISVDLRAVGEFDYRFNRSFQIGTRLLHQKNRAYRFVVGYYSGYSIFGQYFNQFQRFFSVGFFADY